MDLNELQEMFATDEGKELLGQLAQSAGYVAQSEVEGLINKKTELLGNNRKLKDKINELQGKLDDFDYNDYISLKQLQDDKGSKSNNELAKMQRDLAKLQQQYDESIKAKSSVESELNSLLISNELKNAFTATGISPEHYGILSAAFTGKAKVENDDGKRQVIIDSGDGLGLSPLEYFKSWAQTDGKAYLAKPENRGAGSHQVGSTAGKLTLAEIEKLPSRDERLKAMKENGFV